MKKQIALLAAAALTIIVPVGAQAQTPPWVGGLTPFERPAAAPVVTVFEQTPAWQAQALKGIDEPRTGVGFMKDQGAWHTPFNHPNMPGRYDIRGLHASGKKE